MSAILDLTRGWIVMKGRHVKWLSDGQSFLEHLSDLSQVQCVARCRRCLSAHAVAHLDALRPHYHVTCDCRPKGADVFVDKEIEVAPLLLALGWEVVCPRCDDGVRGENAVGDSRWTVTCQCTTREFHRTVH